MVEFMKFAFRLIQKRMQWQSDGDLKTHLDICFVQVPPLRELVCESIRNLGQQHLNKTSIIFGTVVRTSNVNSRELSKEFECKQCGSRVRCYSEISE